MEKKIVDRYILARKHLNLTLEYIAKELDCSTGLINAIERNKVDVPNFKYVEFLVNRGIDFDYLLGKSDQMLAGAVKSNNMESENTELRQTLEQERMEKESMAHKIKEMQSTINYLMGELQMLKKTQQMTWATEQNAMASMGKCKTVRLSGNGSRFVRYENVF